MIYRILSAIVVAITILVAGMISGPAVADQITDTTPILASADRTFEGLLAVKEADGVFIVRSEDGTKKRFTLNKDTIVTRNGKPAAYSDLRSRDQIRVIYTSDLVVLEIQAKGS